MANEPSDDKPATVGFVLTALVFFTILEMIGRFSDMVRIAEDFHLVNERLDRIEKMVDPRP